MDLGDSNERKRKESPIALSCVPRATGPRLVVLGSLTMLACSAAAIGATDMDPANARDQAPYGAAIFFQHCARCHGEHGEGLAGAPAIFGPGALPEYPRDSSGLSVSTITDPMELQILEQTRPAGAPWRAPFRTAADLFDFTRVHMLAERAGALPLEDDWAVVTFMVAVQSGATPTDGISARNAALIRIPERK